MDFLKKIEALKQTRKGLLISILIEGILAYIFASWAIDSGSWWLYLLAVIFIVGTLQNIFRLIKSHGKK